MPLARPGMSVGKAASWNCYNLRSSARSAPKAASVVGRVAWASHNRRSARPSPIRFPVDAVWSLKMDRVNENGQFLAALPRSGFPVASVQRVGPTDVEISEPASRRSPETFRLRHCGESSPPSFGAWKARLHGSAKRTGHHMSGPKCKSGIDNPGVEASGDQNDLAAKNAYRPKENVRISTARRLALTADKQPAHVAPRHAQQRCGVAEAQFPTLDPEQCIEARQLGLTHSHHRHERPPRIEGPCHQARQIAHQMGHF